MRIELSEFTPRYRKVVSGVFVCQKCKSFVIEHKPVIPFGFIRRYRQRFGRPFIPESKMTCPNDCHKYRGWGFVDLAEVVRQSEVQGWAESKRERRQSRI